jgi:hypothetical protein
MAALRIAQEKASRNFSNRVRSQPVLQLVQAGGLLLVTIRASFTKPARRWLTGMIYEIVAIATQTPKGFALDQARAVPWS